MDDKSHEITIENRNHLQTSGVKDIYSFDESRVVLETSLGTLSITGEGLHINKLNIDDGNLTVKGTIHSCIYTESKDLREKSRGFFSRIFK
jgi:sporulation protein YabP